MTSHGGPYRREHAFWNPQGVTQRDKAEGKTKARHGPKWHDSKAAIEAQRQTVKHAKRSRRRLDKAVIDEGREDAAK